VVVFRSQRNNFYYAARQTGARLVEIESDGDALAGVLTRQTACVLWFEGADANSALPLERVVEIAHAQGVAVIVDAAAQIPPISTLWHLTRELGRRPCGASKKLRAL